MMESKQMKKYIIWNNKECVGKSTLTFNLASMYAMNHPDEEVLIIDLCPQSNISSIMLGETEYGGISLLMQNLKNEVMNPLSGRSIFIYFLHVLNSLQTPIKNYNVDIEEFLVHVASFNKNIPSNIKLFMGSQNLSIIENELVNYANNENTEKNQEECWIQIHTCLKNSLKKYLGESKKDICVFIDTSANLYISTCIGIITADNLLVPILPDYTSAFGIEYMLSLLYGPSNLNKSFASRVRKYDIELPKLHTIILNNCISSYKNFKRVSKIMNRTLIEFLQKLYLSENGRNIFKDPYHKIVNFEKNYIKTIPEFVVLAKMSSYYGNPIYNINENMNNSTLLSKYNVVKHLMNIVCSL